MNNPSSTLRGVLPSFFSTEEEYTIDGCLTRIYHTCLIFFTRAVSFLDYMLNVWGVWLYAERLSLLDNICSSKNDTLPAGSGSIVFLKVSGSIVSLAILLNLWFVLLSTMSEYFPVLYKMVKLLFWDLGIWSSIFYKHF